MILATFISPFHWGVELIALLGLLLIYSFFREMYLYSKEKKETKELYPYVYINEDGSYREITKEEKGYLETKFPPFDGGRPYIKNKYSSKTPDGKISGYLRRENLKRNIEKKSS